MNLFKYIALFALLSLSAVFADNGAVEVERAAERKLWTTRCHLTLGLNPSSVTGTEWQDWQWCDRNAQDGTYGAYQYCGNLGSSKSPSFRCIAGFNYQLGGSCPSGTKFRSMRPNGSTNDWKC